MKILSDSSFFNFLQPVAATPMHNPGHGMRSRIKGRDYRRKVFHSKKFK
jgi:hypothetical protein